MNMKKREPLEISKDISLHFHFIYSSKVLNKSQNVNLLEDLSNFWENLSMSTRHLIF
jgi:hypothetical protein